MPESARPSDSGGPVPPFKDWHPRRLTKSGSHWRLWLFAAVGFLLVAAAVIAIARFISRRETLAPAASEPAPDTSQSIQHCVVQPGEIMPALLRRAGVTAPTADSIIAALRLAGYNFRRMRPGDSLAVVHSDGRLSRVLYRQSQERIYRVDIDSADCRVSMVYRTVARTSGLVTGQIQSSLYESMLELGEKPALIADYADIFGWEVDFFSETQTGDSFTVLVERRFADSAFIGYGPILAACYKGLVGEFWAFRFTDPDNHTDYYNPEAQSLRKTFLKSPLRFSRITSFFGTRYHPIRRIRCPHNGVDYAAPTGTPVSCVADGRVTSAGRNGGFGKLVEVSHANGYLTRYGHLSRYGKGIKSGAAVTQGQTIGYVGSTGLSTGPHLHYEVRKYGTPINPMRMDVPRAEPVRLPYLDAFRALRDSLTEAVGLLAGAAPQPLPDPEQP